MVRAKPRLTVRVGAIAGLIALLALGCTCGEPEGIPEEGPAPTSAELETFARATNELGWRVYGRLATEEPNVVYSPASTQLALVMIEAGAAGETRRELLDLLNEGESERGLERAATATLRRWLIEGGGERAVEVRSRVFTDQGSPVRALFGERLRERLGAGVASLDFRNDPEGSGNAIAAWMQQAHPAAPAVLVDEAARLVAVTQLRFEGRWAHPFQEGATSEQPFSRADGEVVRVPTMWLSAELPYAEVGGARCVELAYEDRRFGLLLVRPSGDAALSELTPSAERLARWVDALEERSVDLSLPRFALDPQTHELAEQLSGLGLARLFDRQRADLSRMLEGGEPLALAALVQVAQIEVDERGTRAAATTVASVVASSASPAAVTLRFNRPFWFVLRDRETRAVLFLGHVGDPARGRGE